MKKILSVLMATLMLITLLTPISVFAQNGPYPTDWENMTEENIGDITAMAAIGVIDYDTFEMGYVYPAFMAEIMPVQDEGTITYDEKTNTLTLKNFKTEKILTVTSMGDDFKINVSGYNEIGCIISADMSWGCSITVTGSGALVVNKNKTYPTAVEMDVSGTGYGFFKTEKTVATKFFGNVDTEISEALPTISVYGTKEADPSKVIILEGELKADKALRAEPFESVVYEQIQACWVDKYWGTGEYFVSNKDEFKDRLFIGETYDDVVYDLYEVVYDEELENFVIVYTEEFCGIKLDDYGFKAATGETSVPAVILDIWLEPMDMNTCIDENGKLCVFEDYTIDENEPDIEVYEIFEHSKYGKLALMYNPKKTYKKLNVKGTETYYECLNESSVITTNTVVEKVPGKVKLTKAVNSASGVKITWEAQETAESYIVYRKASGEKKFKKIGTTTKTAYVDKTAKSGVKYEYTVKGKNVIGNGSCQKPGVSVTYMATPTATISNTSAGIKIKWNKVDTATSYNVYRSQYKDGKWTSWEKITTAKKDATSYTDKKAKSGAKYKYSVKAVNGKIKSTVKSSDSLVRLKTTTAKVSPRTNGIKLSWSKVTGAKQYKLYRSEYKNGKWSSWSTLTKVDKAVTSFVDETAKKDGVYKYSVKAVNGSSLSARASTGKIMFVEAPSTTIANGKTGVSVKWTQVEGAEQYIIYRAEVKDGKWTSYKKVKTAKGTSQSWTDKNVVSGTKYKYVVKAQKGEFKSYYHVSNKLVYLKATTVKYREVEEGIKLTWNKVPGAEKYVVYRKVNDVSNGSGWSDYTKYKTVDKNTTSWVDNGVVYLRETYVYKVCAVNGDSKGKCAETAGPVTYMDIVIP